MEIQADLASQIQKLHKDIFWTRCILGAALVCLATVIVANSWKHPNTVEANQFLVRDRAGNVTARLGQDSFGDTCLTLVAEQNISIASMSVQGRGGASLDLHNLKSESSATLTPGFYMFEPLAQVQLALIVNGVNYTAGKR